MKVHVTWLPQFALGAAAFTLLILMAANALVLVKITKTLEALPSQQTGKSLPCRAIPTRFILEDPGCAQKLLAAMNVTNIRVSTLPAGLPEEANSTDAREPRGRDSALTW